VSNLPVFKHADVTNPASSLEQDSGRLKGHFSKGRDPPILTAPDYWPFAAGRFAQTAEPFTEGLWHSMQAN
jgi:hypothetical protein